MTYAPLLQAAYRLFSVLIQAENSFFIVEKLCGRFLAAHSFEFFCCRFSFGNIAA